MVEPRKDSINDCIDTMILYLIMKVEVGDWHAVADAANDLRELEVRLEYASFQEAPSLGASRKSGAQ